MSQFAEDPVSAAYYRTYGDTGAAMAEITWVNRGNAGFDEAYGSHASLARAVAQRAIADWSFAVQSFNYDDSSFPDAFQLRILATEVDAGSVGGVHPASFEVDRNGLPRHATVHISSDPFASGPFGPWFFSADPLSRFSTRSSDYRATSPEIEGLDFYSVMLHEIAHALGFSVLPLGLALNERLNSVDPDNDDPAVRRLMNFDSIDPLDPVQATFDGAHLWAGSDPQVPAGIPVHPNFLALASDTGIERGLRTMITPLDLRILAEAYGYSVVAPTALPTLDRAAPGEDAAFAAQSIPRSLRALEERDASVTMRNSGSTAWSAAHKLTSLSKGWTVDAIPLGRTVPPGDSITVRFQLSALTSGDFTSQWQLSRPLGVDRFGEVTPKTSVDVTPSNPQPDECAGVRAEHTAANAQLTQTQTDLKGADTKEKPFLVAQIRQIKGTITSLEKKAARLGCGS